jgi:cell wall-associated NlpC family hydrolase
MKEIFGKDLPTMDEDYSSIEDRATLQRLITQHSSDFTRVENPQPGDLVLMRVVGFNSHIGLVLEKGNFLHMWKGAGVVVERLTGPEWRHRIEGYYRYAR